jgi:hypothetical protein
MKRWLFAAFGVTAALMSGAAMAHVNVGVAIGVPGVVIGVLPTTRRSTMHRRR